MARRAGALLEEVGGGARVGAPHGRRLAQRHRLLAALRVQLVRVGAALAVAEAGDRRHGDQEEGRAQADAHQSRRRHCGQKQNALVINRISRIVGGNDESKADVLMELYVYMRCHTVALGLGARTCDKSHYRSGCWSRSINSVSVAASDLNYDWSCV